MSRSISLNIWNRIKQKAGRLKEDAEHRKQVINTRIEAKALEGTGFGQLSEGTEPLRLAFGELSFASEDRDFDQIPAALLLNRKIEEFGSEFSNEQVALLNLIDQAAETRGFGMEIEKVIPLPQEEPVVSASLSPGRNFQGTLDSGFEDKKALPPVSTEFERLTGMFENEPETEVIEV